MGFKTCILMAFTAAVIPATLAAQAERADHPLTAAIDTLQQLGGHRVAVLGQDAEIVAGISRSASDQRVQVADRDRAITCLPGRPTTPRCSLIDADALISVSAITRAGESVTVEAELIKPNKAGRLHGTLYSIRVVAHGNVWTVAAITEAGASTLR
jgi:hypothetical protein